MTHDDRAAVPVGSELTEDALRGLVDAAPDGIVVVDEAGTIVFVNPMLERLFDYSREELLGQSIESLVPVGAEPSHAAHRAAYMDQPRPRAMGSGLELRGRQRSGAELPVEISLSPLRGRGRTLVVAIVRDVSERRKTESELERVREDLVVAEERERIARDLHDTVIQRLFAVGLSLQAVLVRLGTNPAVERLNESIDNIDETIRDLRSAIFALHTRRPGGAGLRDEVLGVSHEVARVLGFEPVVVFDGPVDSATTDTMQEHLVATLREALSNVARHAGASRVDLSVNVEQNHLVLRVADNGRGVGDHPGLTGSGDGLSNMLERAEDLGGRCELSAGDSGGTTIVWRIPIGDRDGIA